MDLGPLAAAASNSPPVPSGVSKLRAPLVVGRGREFIICSICVLRPVVKTFFGSIFEQCVAVFRGGGGGVSCRCFPLARPEPPLLALYEWLHTAANPSGPVGSPAVGWWERRGRVGGGTLILNVRVEGQCDPHLRAHSCVLRGCEVAAGKTRGCWLRASRSLPLITAGELCSRPRTGPTSERLQNVSAANLAFQPFDAGWEYCFIL